MRYLKQRFARVSSALLAAVYGPQVLSCIVLGRLSDRCAPRMPIKPCNAPSGVVLSQGVCHRHGRKPVIVWSLAGCLLLTLAAGSTKTLWQVSDAPRASCLKSPSFSIGNTLCERLVWPMCGVRVFHPICPQALPLRALGGALGGYASVAYAMACDVLDETQSGMGVALLVTAWGLGSAVGQRGEGSSGHLYLPVANRGPFVSTAGVGLASALRAGQAWPVFADRPLLLPSVGGS
jgi:MFS family permease